MNWNLIKHPRIVILHLKVYRQLNKVYRQLYKVYRQLYKVYRQLFKVYRLEGILTATARSTDKESQWILINSFDKCCLLSLSKIISPKPRANKIAQ